MHIYKHLDAEKLLDTIGTWTKIDKTIREIISGREQELNMWVHHSYNIQFVMWNILNIMIEHGYAEFNYNNILDIVVASALHDIGKLLVPTWILNKPGALTGNERKLVNLHVKIGVDIIDTLFTGFNNHSIFKISKELAEFHHENWDGSGYLRGLVGEEIPLLARVCSIADTYAALVENRPYKERIWHDEAVKIIGNCSGSKFDPLITELFVSNSRSTSIETYKGLSFIEVLMQHLKG